MLTSMSIEPLKYPDIVLPLFVLLSLGALAATVAAAPARSQRFAVSACSAWERFWPLRRGGGIGFRALRLLYALGIFKPVPVRLKAGFLMELDARDYVTAHILADSIYEPTITSLTTGLLKEGAVFVDVGANVGYYTLLASVLVGAGGMVVAIEPNPDTVERLRRNIRLNKFTNIFTVPVAATETEQYLEFFEADVSNTGKSSLSSKNARSSKSAVVRGIPLDEIIQGHNIQRVDLVKIDVEGAELRVLQGMSAIMETFRPTIITELFPELLANLGASVDQVAECFRYKGYVLAQQIDANNYLWAPDPVRGAGIQRGLPSPTDEPR